MGRELLIVGEKDVWGAALITALAPKKWTDGEKEETWNRLNELPAFALVGFGCFSVRIGAGAYNRERKATIARQSVTDRDALWGQESESLSGIGFPNAWRHCHGAVWMIYTMQEMYYCFPIDTHRRRLSTIRSIWQARRWIRDGNNLLP